MDFIARLFDSSGFVPRSLCGDWSTSLILLHNFSDALIWLSYVAIPFVLVYFIRRRRDLPFPRARFLRIAKGKLCRAVWLGASLSMARLR